MTPNLQQHEQHPLDPATLETPKRLHLGAGEGIVRVETRYHNLFEQMPRRRIHRAGCPVTSVRALGGKHGVKRERRAQPQQTGQPRGR